MRQQPKQSSNTMSTIKEQTYVVKETRYHYACPVTGHVIETEEEALTAANILPVPEPDVKCVNTVQVIPVTSDFKKYPDFWVNTSTLEHIQEARRKHKGPRSGKLIAIEGIDGCGKSTQAEMLANALLSAGHKVKILHFPTTSEHGTAFRDAINNGIPMGTSRQIELMSRDRSQALEKIIRPALQDGMYVICDRFALSTLFYQGGKSHKASEEALSTVIPDLIECDSIINLVIKPEDAIARIRMRITHTGQSDMAALETEESLWSAYMSQSYHMSPSVMPREVQDKSLTLDATRDSYVLAHDILKFVTRTK